ncbi:unnamed protein product, partial [Brassica oleracea var. botrytis]
LKLSLGIQDQLSCVCDLHESCLVRDLHESCLVREFNRNACVSKLEGGVTRSARGIKTRFWPRRREKALDLRIPKCQDEVIKCYLLWEHIFVGKRATVAGESPLESTGAISTLCQ